MRISSILRVVEDQVIHTSGRVATATKVAVREIDRELQIRALYAIEAHQQKKERLAELRAVIKAADDLHAYKSSAEFVEAMRQFREDHPYEETADAR